MICCCMTLSNSRSNIYTFSYHPRLVQLTIHRHTIRKPRNSFLGPLNNAHLPCCLEWCGGSHQARAKALRTMMHDYEYPLRDPRGSNTLILKLEYDFRSTVEHSACHQCHGSRRWYVDTILTCICSAPGNTTTKRVALRIFVKLRGYPCTYTFTFHPQALTLASKSSSPQKR